MCLFLVASLDVTEIYITKCNTKHQSTCQGNPLPGNLKAATDPFSYPYCTFPKAEHELA